jgi:hypothetical protein
MEERVSARGHEHVSATHESTFEVTTDDYLTPAGDCILGIEADRAPSAFDDSFVSACQTHEATIQAVLQVGSTTTTVLGHGHPDLTFASDRSLVCRTSEYVDDRTVLVGADAAAAHLDRALVDALADGAEMELSLRVR